MRLPLLIMMLYSALLLTGCDRAEAPLNVRAALPICPEPIVLPQAMWKMPDLPDWFPMPTAFWSGEATGPKSLLPPDKPQCVPARGRN